MLVIKNEQIEYFIAKDEPELENVLTEIIREACHERVLDYPDERLKAMVRIGIERARSRKIESAPDIAAFVAIMFEIAPGFDEQKEINFVLKDETYTITDRLLQLDLRVSEEAWQEAEKFYKVEFWFPEKSE